MTLLSFQRRSSSSPAPQRGVAKPGIFAALDVGTSKVTCFIGRRETGKSGQELPLRVIGIGHQISHGIKNGSVVDMDAAEHAIRSAVDQAERMAGVTLRHIALSLSNGRPKSQIVEQEIDLHGQEVREQDQSEVLMRCRAACQIDGREMIHTLPVSYSIDGTRGIQDPRGMYGERLGLELHAISLVPGPMRNIILCVERCHLDVVQYAVSSFASGIACLVDDEINMGAVCIDMGGGTTDISVFQDGVLQFAGCVPLGGDHVTADLAQGLATPLADAERMKTLYGSALGGPGDDREMLHVPQVGDDGVDDNASVPRSVLTKIIRPRLEEIFEMSREMLHKNGFDDVAGRQIVLTGGASQLNGVRELAMRAFDNRMLLGQSAKVRIGKPRILTGLAESTRGPAFSTCAGLLSFYADPPDGAFGFYAEMSGVGANGGLGRVRQWFRQFASG